MDFDELVYRAEYWAREVIRREKLGHTVGAAYSAALSNWRDAEERLAVAQEGDRLGKVKEVVEVVMDWNAWEFGEAWTGGDGQIMCTEEYRPRNSLVCKSKGEFNGAPRSVLLEVRECLVEEDDKECTLIGVTLPSGVFEVRIAPPPVGVIVVKVDGGDPPLPPPSRELSDRMGGMFEDGEYNYRCKDVPEEWVWSVDVWDGVEADVFMHWLIGKGKMEIPVLGIEVVEGGVLYLYQFPEGSRIDLLE